MGTSQTSGIKLRTLTHQITGTSMTSCGHLNTSRSLSMALNVDVKFIQTNFNEALADITKKHHIIMNFWTPDWCADHLESDESMPWYTRYDYVKAYDYKGKDANGEDIFEMRW